MNPLVVLQELADKLGGIEWVQGAGGNVSVKSEDGTLWVKASGHTLGQITQPGGYCQVSLDLVKTALKGDAVSTKQLFQAVPRPSMETYFHVLPRKVIAHTHPVGTLLLACSSLPIPPYRELPVDVPYRRPGYEIAKYLTQVDIDTNRPSVFLLRNHGLLVSGDTADEVIRLTVNLNRLIRATFHENASFSESLTQYQRNVPLPLSSCVARILPEAPVRSGDSPRYLFPDSVIYSSRCRISGKWDGNVSRLPHNHNWNGGRALIFEDDEGSRVLLARTLRELQWSTEILAVHDWLEKRLTPLSCIRYLDESESKYLLEMPEEQYRMVKITDLG